MIASMFLLLIRFLWWVPLVIAGLAGPAWLLTVYWRRSVKERRMALMPEEDFVP
jgi:hypothetical protein